MKDMVDVSTRALADVLSPDPEDEARFARLRAAYGRDAAETKEDAEAFDLRIEAHEKAAEGYERAQLCAEIGIVIASTAADQPGSTAPRGWVEPGSGCRMTRSTGGRDWVLEKSRLARK